jgi:hypothetical protein
MIAFPATWRLAEGAVTPTPNSFEDNVASATPWSSASNESTPVVDDTFAKRDKKLQLKHSRVMKNNLGNFLMP